MRAQLRPDLAAYVSLTLLVLWNIADRFAPYHGRAETVCSIGYVYDGDTVELRCPKGTSTARIVGLNTPEQRDAQCAAEAAHAKTATLRLRQILRQGDIQIFRQGFDKYNRELVVITVAGANVADIMVAEGLAESYAGGRRRNWCVEGF
jgi:endonuclease YncB( thermonuclease family)